MECFRTGMLLPKIIKRLKDVATSSINNDHAYRMIFFCLKFIFKAVIVERVFSCE